MLFYATYCRPALFLIYSRAWDGGVLSSFRTVRNHSFQTSRRSERTEESCITHVLRSRTSFRMTPKGFGHPLRIPITPGDSRYGIFNLQKT